MVYLSCVGRITGFHSLGSILPVLDNFEHTLQNAETAETTEVLVKGIQIVYDQMLDILKSHEVEQIKSLNEKFDPSLHQAMMQRLMLIPRLLIHKLRQCQMTMIKKLMIFISGL